VQLYAVSRNKDGVFEGWVGRDFIDDPLCWLTTDMELANKRVEELNANEEEGGFTFATERVFVIRSHGGVG